jgi:hypothetical protein
VSLDVAAEVDKLTRDVAEFRYHAAAWRKTAAGLPAPLRPRYLANAAAYDLAAVVAALCLLWWRSKRRVKRAITRS